MRPTLWIAALAVAVTLSSACAADASSAAPEGSAEAQVWFERALALDLGAGGAPDAILAFAAMRRAAEAGHPQAAFNVAVMLDSGRGARRNVAEAAVWYARAAARGIRRAAFNLGQQVGGDVPGAREVDICRHAFAAFVVAGSSRAFGRVEFHS